MTDKYNPPIENKRKGRSEKLLFFSSKIIERQDKKDSEIHLNLSYGMSIVSLFSFSIKRKTLLV